MILHLRGVAYLSAVMSGSAATTNPTYSVIWNGDSSLGSLNGSTPATIVPALGANGGERWIDSIYIFNGDTAAVTVTLSKITTAGTFKMHTVTIPMGAHLEWTDTGIRTVTSGGYLLSTAADTSASGTAQGTGVVATEIANGGYHKTVLTCTNLSIASVDHTTNNAQGSQAIYTFPAGAIQVSGVSCNLTTLTGSQNATTGLAATAAVVGAIGTVAPAATVATLTSTTANILASMAGTLASFAGAFSSYGGIVTTPFNGTVTPITALFNIATPDAGSAGNDTLVLNGSIILYWNNLNQ
jgi:hypothetical protein